MPKLAHPGIQGTLFHFTDSYDNLIGILANEFLPRYCLEDMAIWAGERTAGMSWAVPMVCFCDLRLSQVSTHIGRYGGYGIGLTKEWGRRNGLAPLIYLNSGSRTAELFKEIVSLVAQEKQVQADQPHPSLNALVEFESFFKPYEGQMNRRGVRETVRFYDEREWRYIPKTADGTSAAPYPYRLSEEDFADEKRRQDANEAIGELGVLGFDPWDICYLFVRSDEEIVPLVNSLYEIKGQYGHEEIVLLTTRILATNRMPLDF